SALAKHDLDRTEGQLAALDEAAPIVARIKDQGMRARYAVNLDRWLGLMDERFVLARVRQHAAGTRGGRDSRSRSDDSLAARNGQRRADSAESRPYDKADPVLRVEREALKLAVQWPALCGPEFDALGAAAFGVPVHGSVFGLIEGRGGVASAGRARDWVAALLEAAPDDRARGFVTELAVEPLQVRGEPDERYADVVLARVGELAAGREIAAIKARLQRMNPEDDQPAYNKMFGDLVALEQRRKWLLGRATGG
ncbi:MAG TPA: DNA primase, partial [Trebonia sp.]|nr:DNA primase [Trebonia sp.]